MPEAEFPDTVLPDTVPLLPAVVPVFPDAVPLLPEVVPELSDATVPEAAPEFPSDNALPESDNADASPEELSVTDTAVMPTLFPSW